MSRRWGTSMFNRHMYVYVAMVVSGAFALLGAAVFVVGIVSELLARDEPRAGISVSIQLALSGLCLAGVMALLVFGLVAVLIARQARERGAGYGDAYRLTESFHFREAVPLLEELVRSGTGTSDILMLLTSAYGYSGQLAKAQSTADRAVQLYPEDPRAYVTLATGYRMQAAYEEAATALKIALERDPSQASLWAELGFVQRFAGHAEAAFASFEQAALSVLPAMYGLRVHYHLTQAYQARGEAEKAVKSASRMMAARDGLAVWQASLAALAGTTYGTALRYEINDIARALDDADAGSVR